MPYKLNPEQFKAVFALSSEKRFHHFNGRIADWEQLWGVRSDEGWLVPKTPEGMEYFPVWPHPEYAQRTTDLHFPGHTATEISLTEFMDDWLPRFQKDSVQVAVFPDLDWNCWIISPHDLLDALEWEVSQYE